MHNIYNEWPQIIQFNWLITQKYTPECSCIISKSLLGPSGRTVQVRTVQDIAGHMAAWPPLPHGILTWEGLLDPHPILVVLIQHNLHFRSVRSDLQNAWFLAIVNCKYTRRWVQAWNKFTKYWVALNSYTKFWVI